MIEHIQEKHPESTMQARRDFAHITKQRVVEPPYWFKDSKTGNEYYGMHAGIGWPQKMSGRGDELPGYAVVVGVRKIQGMDPGHARFDILDEVEERAEDLLIRECVAMRDRWGYGVHHQIMPVFVGDHRPFELVVADYNTRVAETTNDDRHAFIVSPPDDFDNPKAFDIFMGRVRSVLSEKAKRLYLNNHQAIKNRIVAFTRDDPAITALGGLIHTLLIRQPWMEQSTPSVWQLPEI